MKQIVGSAFFVLFFTIFFSHFAYAANTSISSGVSVNGKLASSSSENTYQFTTTKDGEAYITIDHATGGLSLEIDDANGNYVDSESISSAGETIKLDEHLKKGTYYVKITSSYWDGITSASYQLKATYPGSIKRDNTSFEPNDTFETSFAIKSGQFYSSTCESNIDKDVYQFTTTQDGEAYITLDHATGSFSLEIDDIYGNNVDSESISSAGETTKLYEHLKKGTYYVQIKPYSYYWDGLTSATYRVKATYPGSINRDSSSFESNDTLETSFPITSRKYYSSSSYSEIDRDVYQFTTNQDGNASITLDHTTGSFSLEIEDANGNYVDSESISSAGETIAINDRLKKGKYYIVITPYYWDGLTSASYRLKASFLDKAPTVNTISDHSTAITGKAESKIKVYAYANGKKLGETTATNGEYSIKIPKQKAGTVITVYTVDAAGNRSADKTVKVLDRTPPTTPTVSSVSDWSTVISGTAESNARVYAYAKSKKLGEATAKSGKYSLKLSKQKAGTVITVYAVDPSGNKSGSRTVKVLDKTPPATPSVNKVTSKSTTITGSAEKSATVYVYNKSKKLGSGKVDSKGHFKVKIKAQKKKINTYRLCKRRSR